MEPRRRGRNAGRVSTPATPRCPATASGVAVANHLPHSLVIPTPTPFEENPPRGRQGRQDDFAGFRRLRRQSAPELHRRPEGREGSLGRCRTTPKADDIPAGMIHDFRYREGSFVPGFLNPLRTQLEDYPTTSTSPRAMTNSWAPRATTPGPPSAGRWSTWMRGRRLPTSNPPGMPHLGSASAGRGRTARAGR